MKKGNIFGFLLSWNNWISTYFYICLVKLYVIHIYVHTHVYHMFKNIFFNNFFNNFFDLRTPKIFYTIWKCNVLNIEKLV